MSIIRGLYEEGVRNWTGPREVSVKESEVPLASSYEQDIGNCLNIFHGCHLEKEIIWEGSLRRMTCYREKKAYLGYYKEELFENSKLDRVSCERVRFSFWKDWILDNHLSSILLTRLSLCRERLN